MKMKAIALVGLIWVTPVFADCDLLQFHWSCNLPVQEKPIGDQSYLVYCRNTPVYVSKAVYEEVIRYQRANVNMDLRTDDEFIEGPCVPGRSVHVNEYNFVRETPMGQRYWGKDRALYK
jgi:hypothetical protein